MNQASTQKPIALLAAGGTGGHMFPASVLAEQLKAAGYGVHLATDARGLAYVDQLTPMETHTVPAATVFNGGILALPFRILTLALSVLKCWWLVRKLRPAVVVGFGGYPSFGPVLAGLWLGRPVLVHEQNAVLGRVNRWAANYGASVATSYNQTAKVPAKASERLRRTGNPLRAAVLQTAKNSYSEASKSGIFELLVFGGSQGASVFSDVVPRAIEALPNGLQNRLRLVHQVRRADLQEAFDFYGKLGVDTEIREFFDDLPSRMRRAHLVISRGGASTIGEIAALGAPSLIVPLPGSLDQDQALNAIELSQMGGAVMVRQADFTPAYLAEKLSQWMQAPELLSAMSQRASASGELDAAGRLFRYAHSLASGLPVQIDLPAADMRQPEEEVRHG
jgi:UDP-N-acetylglucosamine--N-acetylmuramyl-(pentapeptide) pyrophosphoryl-undecaprenol N-acetylglucosamine transferase